MKRAADRIASAVDGKATTQVWFAFDHLQTQGDILSGATVDRVYTVGKALLIAFEPVGVTIYTHNQLYGRWYVKKAGERPRTNRQLRLLIETETHAALLYSASSIEVWPTADIRRQSFISKAGIDPLDPKVTVDQLLEKMQDRRFRNRQLAGLLLDQSFVAGMGNYLRADVLNGAQVDPACKPADLTKRQCRRLSTTLIELMRQSYETGGVTNDAERVQQLKSRGVRRSRYRHVAYARAGEPCYQCGGMIVRRDMGGRGLYLCDTCQQRGD